MHVPPYSLYQVTLRHDASRIVESILQFGTEKQREKILTEIANKLFEIAKTPYGHFVVLKVPFFVLLLLLPLLDCACVRVASLTRPSLRSLSPPTMMFPGHQLLQGGQRAKKDRPRVCRPLRLVGGPRHRRAHGRVDHATLPHQAHAQLEGGILREKLRGVGARGAAQLAPGTCAWVLDLYVGGQPV